MENQKEEMKNRIKYFRYEGEGTKKYGTNNGERAGYFNHVKQITFTPYDRDLIVRFYTEEHMN